MILSPLWDDILVQMELYFGTLLEPRAATIEKNKVQKQDGPTAVKTLRAEPKEGDKGGGEPPPLGFGGVSQEGAADQVPNKTAQGQNYYSK